jgi:hypothetical protein
LHPDGRNLRIVASDDDRVATDPNGRAVRHVGRLVLQEDGSGERAVARFVLDAKAIGKELDARVLSRYEIAVQTQRVLSVAPNGKVAPLDVQSFSPNDADLALDHDIDFRHDYLATGAATVGIAG